MNVFSALSSLVALSSVVPYALDTIRGKTHPHRTTWLLLCLLSLGFIYGQLASPGSGLVLASVQLIAVSIVFALSLKYGEGGMKKSELVLLVLAILSLIIGIQQNNPQATLYFNILTGMIAYLPTFIKTWKKPESETLLTWFMGVLGAVLALAGANYGKVDSIIFLSYVLFVNFAVMAIIIAKRPSRTLVAIASSK